jgi:hypothetical protein
MIAQLAPASQLHETPSKQRAAFAEDVIETPVKVLAKTDKLEVEKIPDKKNHTINCNRTADSRFDT